MELSPTSPEDVKILIESPVSTDRSGAEIENIQARDKELTNAANVRKRFNSVDKLSSTDKKNISDFLSAVLKPSEKFDLKKEFYADPVPVRSWHELQGDEADFHHKSGIFPHSWQPLGHSSSSGPKRLKSHHKLQKHHSKVKAEIADEDNEVVISKSDHSVTSNDVNHREIIVSNTSNDSNSNVSSPKVSQEQIVAPHDSTDGGGGSVDKNVDKIDQLVLKCRGDVEMERRKSISNNIAGRDEVKKGLLKTFPSGVEKASSSAKVAFYLGADEIEGTELTPDSRVSTEVISSSKHYQPRKYGNRNKSGSRVFGSEVYLESPHCSQMSNVEDLHGHHLDVMTSHRLNNAKGMRHRRVDRRSFDSVSNKKKELSLNNHVVSFPQFSTIPEEDAGHHKMFVELDELRLGDNNEWEWREKARWIKFEEEVEEGACRWGKPHVSSLSFHSLVELRRCLESGAVMLDLDADDLPTISSRIVDQLVITDQLTEELKPHVLQVLLLKHKHQSEQQSFIRRNHPLQNLSSLAQSHSVVQSSNDGDVTTKLLDSVTSSSDKSSQDHPNIKESKTAEITALYKYDKEITHNSSTKSLPASPASSPFGFGGQRYSVDMPHIFKRIPIGAEATNVLVGPTNILVRPVAAFVRLKNAVCLNNVTEVPLPVRFIFILMGPDNNSLDYHEIGRSLSTLMADEHFHDAAYIASNRTDILDSLNEFLNGSMVLPPGEWDKKTLLPIVNITKEKQKGKKKVKKAKEPPSYDPLKRTGKFFRGLKEDARHRYPHYWSDIKDGLNLQCFAAFFFVYFACLSPAITFGGLLGEKTDKLMGVNEMLVATAICGVIFSLASGQPLVIIGATGPVLVFEEALYKICHAFNLEFLPFRVWVSIWVSVVSVIGVMLEISVLVRFITRFTEEIFALLISLIFIYEVFKKLFYIFHKNPLLEYYLPQNFGELHNMCYNFSSRITDVNMSTSESYYDYNVTTLSPYVTTQISAVLSSNISHDSNHQLTNLNGFSLNNLSFFDNLTSIEISKVCNLSVFQREYMPHPNTAFLSVILTFGTFLLAYSLKSFRNSKFFGRNARRAIGDFGVPISIMMMALADYFIPNTYTEKLDVPEGFSPTAPSKRSWFISPFGDKTSLPLWSIVAAIIPSVFIFILLYMESVITSMIVNKKDRCLKKGSGYHLDLFVTGVCATICGFLGLPFMCSATVRSVTHVAALSVFSRTHAPGDKPHLVRVHEQRLTSFAVHLLVGISVLMGPVLGKVPTAVLFGIFLYMGIASMSGIQLLKRLKLMFMPIKHHPDVGYVKKVRLWKMNLFTFLQLIFLAILWVVKSSRIALAFPFILILIVPVRLHLFKCIFTDVELHELDSEENCPMEDEEDEPDFYTQAHMPM